MASEQKLEFDFDMACDGCYKAAQRNLGKIGVDAGKVEADVAAKKLWVTTDKTDSEVMEQLKKTGKAATFVGAK